MSEAATDGAATGPPVGVEPRPPATQGAAGLHVPAGTPGALWGPGDRHDILLTGAHSDGSVFLVECHVAEGGGSPPHIHHRETESFYVLSGAFGVTVDDESFEAAAGDLVVVPRGRTHSFANRAAGVSRMLAFFTPAGMEGWFTDALDDAADRDAVPPPPTPETMARMLAIGPRYGVEWRIPGA